MEQEIIHTTIDKLNGYPHIKAMWKEYQHTDTGGRLLLQHRTQKLAFETEVKKEVRKHHLHRLLEQAAHHNPFLVLAGQILPAAKETLRAAGIAYLEANGNTYIDHEGLFIWVDGNKPFKLEEEGGNRAFTKTGLKVVFLFLQDETWLNKPYRRIAEQTGTGIGNITNILNGLKAEGFLLPLNKSEYRLHNKKALLERWLAAYYTRLKPTLRIGRFRFLNQEEFNAWKRLPLSKGKTWWGGEPAGDLLTNYLKPGELTLYTDEKRMDIIKKYRLVPDEKGSVKVYNTFWNWGKTADATVPPLLVYADLMNVADQRCRETAQKVYEEHLQDKF